MAFSHLQVFTAAGKDSAAGEASKQKREGRLQKLRKMAAQGMRNLAEMTAEHISK